MDCRFRQVFSTRHVVLPVVHVETPDQALRNTQLARDAGADGVFLINHSISDAELLTIHQAAAAAHPGWWIGLNCLGLAPATVLERVSPQVGGVWVDNAQIDETQPAQPQAEAIHAVRQAHAPGCLYFGGVAFKYQRSVEHLEAACRIARRYLDVVTTSGEGTGYAASVEKIQRMKQALGDWPLAIASGITPENVRDYLPHADCFLVATGISRTFTELDEERLRRLMLAVREG